MGHEASRQRREPEGTVLYRVVQSEWTTTQAQLAANERYVPQFCRREVDAFPRPLVFTVDLLCHFRVELTESDAGARLFEIHDAKGKRLMIRDAALRSVTTSSEHSLQNGKSKVLSTSERAATMVVFGKDRKELFRIQLRLNHKSVMPLTR